MGRYFGTDGFRGEVGVNLNAEQAYRIGRFLGYHFASYSNGKKVRVLIGRDTRLSGNMLECALSAGLTASGADAYLAGVTTTPCISFLIIGEEFDCGIMISASHNPYYDNGIKLFNGNGEKMEDAVVSLVEDYIDGATDLPAASRKQIGRTVDFSSGVKAYEGYLAMLCPQSLRGCKIGLDCANGSSYKIARRVFTSLGAEVFVINDKPNGVNINDNAGSTHIEGLQKLVKEKKLFVGFAYDGDADRCICVDDMGEIADGDKILYVYGRFLKERGELETNTVVTTVMSNFGLYKAFDKLGINYAKTDVGDRFVHEYIKANGNLIGGEQSGHIIFSRYASTGDGILTSIMMIGVMLEKGQTLSMLTKDFKEYPQQLTNVKVTDKAAVLSNGAVRAAIEKAERAAEGRGRVLVRASGTEPLIRVMAEAETLDECKALVGGIVEVIKDGGFGRE